MPKFKRGDKVYVRTDYGRLKGIVMYVIVSDVIAYGIMFKEYPNEIYNFNERVVESA